MAFRKTSISLNTRPITRKEARKLASAATPQGSQKEAADPEQEEELEEEELEDDEAEEE